jgi:hypothetical protein
LAAGRQETDQKRNTIIMFLANTRQTRRSAYPENSKPAGSLLPARQRDALFYEQDILSFMHRVSPAAPRLQAAEELSQEIACGRGG